MTVRAGVQAGHVKLTGDVRPGSARSRLGSGWARWTGRDSSQRH